MYCENCGKKIPDDSQFCPECGAPVHHEDESLISRARRNDNEAIQQVMDQYKGMVRYQARMYVKNEDDVNEIEQQVYIKAFSKTSDLTDEKKFGGWLKTIAINTAKDYVTSAFKKRSVMFTDLDDTNNDMVYDAADERIDHVPEAQMDETSRRDIILKVLDTLPETQRTVIVMHYYDNLSFKDIAEQLDIPMSTVTGRVQQAKNSIKASVTEIQNREGIKLYHLSPLGFFIWILGLERTAPVEPPVIGKTVRIDPQKVAAKDNPHYGNNASKTVRAEKTIKNTAKATSKTAIKTGAGKAAAGGTAKAAGTGFLATTAGKAVIAGAIAVAAVGGSAGASTYYRHSENIQKQTVEAENQKKSAQNTKKSSGKQNNGKSDQNQSSNGKSDDKKFIWIKEPGSMDVDGFDSLEGASSFPEAGLTEVNGYSSSWNGEASVYTGEEYGDSTSPDGLGSGKYSENALIITKDKKKGIADYDGRIITNAEYENITDVPPYGIYVVSEPEESGYQLVYHDYLGHDMVVRHNQEGVGLSPAIENPLGTVWISENRICMNGQSKVSLSEWADTYQAENPVIYPVINSDSGSLVSSPDGFAVYEQGKIVNLPDGLTPTYYPELYKNIQNTGKYVETSETYECFVNGVVKCMDSNGKIHLWDYETGKLISDGSYDDATFYEDGYIGVKKNNKWAFMDRDGNPVTDYVFDDVSALYNGRAYVKYQGKVGILDLKATVDKLKK